MPTRNKRLAPKDRKQQIFSAAVMLSHRYGYDKVRREHIASATSIAPSLVNRYWGTMAQLQRAVMRQAVKTEDLKLVAQGLARGDNIAKKAPQELKEKAVATLAEA